MLSGRVLDEDTPAAAGRYGGTPVHMLQTEHLHQSVLWMSRALSLKLVLSWKNGQIDLLPYVKELG